ncbi:MAG: hypothetical protein ACI31S_02195 [Bacilli bacterium]
MIKELQVLLQEIESGKRKDLFGLDLTQEDLLTKDKDGVYFLEHLFKNKISLLPLCDVLNEKKHSAKIVYIFCENDEWIFFELDESVMFSNINGERLIDYILQKKYIGYNTVGAIKEHTEIIDLMCAYNCEYLLFYLNPKIIEKLITKNENGTYLIEKYLNNNKVLKQIISLVSDVNKLIELCNNYNNYELMKYANKNILMSNYNKDTTVLNYLVNEKNIIPDILEYLPSKLDFIKFLMENNFYDYLKKASEEVLLLEIYPEKTLLEILIEKGYRPQIDYINEEKTVDILYKKQMPDLLIKADIKELLSSCGDSNTYFDYILDCIAEKKIKASIQKFIYSASSINEYVKCYLAIAKHDMMEYVKELTVEDLLKEYDGITLLNGLLNADSNLTLNKILTESIKADPKIAVILKSRGLEQENANISSEKNDYTAEYLDKINNSLGIGPLLEEGELLLKQLQQLFLSDGKSDKELISALISGYRHSLFINYKVNVEELKRLIQIKQKNFYRFCYIKKEDSGYFSNSNGSIFCDSAVVETVLHETGHAMHYYLTQNKVPKSYQEITEHTRQNPETLNKVEEYADRFYKLNQKIKLLVGQKYENFFENYYNDEKKEEIKSNLAKSKIEKKEEYSSLGISDEQLEIILENIFTEEEYIAHQKRIFVKENVDAIMRSEFGAFMAIGDILDAIYEGNLYSENQKNHQGEKIKGTAGHGIYYYYNTSHGFDEMIANFAFISKSKDSKEILQLLKKIVGDELYDMISGFYYENIVHLSKEELETKKAIGGK